MSLHDRRLLATFMVQSRLGINDFMPVRARSRDGGWTWAEPKPLWPDLADEFSLFGSISSGPDGQVYFFGARTPIDEPGESLWSDATKGLKQNELFWSRSRDAGRSWSAPTVIPMPFPGSAEAPGPLCVTPGGRWVVCYSPYNTFDPQTTVERNGVIALLSDDRGQTWSHRWMMRFEEPDSGGAEAWVVALADGRLLATSWHTDLSGAERDFPNVYALSSDEGSSWTPTRSTGILGQTTALTALPDGRALFLHTQRKQHAEIGIWMALVNPTPDNFGILHHQPIWQTPTANRAGREATHSDWQQFNFGEPAAILLDDGVILIAFWYIDEDSSGVKYVKVKIVD